MLQLRDKELNDDSLLEVAGCFRAVCREHDALFWLNDRPDLALVAGADGVHVGQDDTPAGAVRAQVGAELLVGALDALAGAVRRGAGRRGGPDQRGPRLGDAHQAGSSRRRARLRATRRSSGRRACRGSRSAASTRRTSGR